MDSRTKSLRETPSAFDTLSSWLRTCGGRLIVIVLLINYHLNRVVINCLTGCGWSSKESHRERQIATPSRHHPAAGLRTCQRYALEVVHLGREKGRVAEAEKAGVKSVPALVLDGLPFHINFGANLAALK